MAKFRLYDTVRVICVPEGLSVSGPGMRPPRVGDIGAVVMTYESPSEGYAVEVVAADGRTEWLIDFRPEDLEKV